MPSYAATAWYPKMLKDRPDNLNAFLGEARNFAQTDYSNALMKGAALSATEKAEVAKKLARFTGLGEDYLVKANLRVNLFQFMKELQRSRDSPPAGWTRASAARPLICSENLPSTIPRRRPSAGHLWPPSTATSAKT